MTSNIPQFELLMANGPFRKHPIETLRNSSVNGNAVVNLVGACSVLAEEINKEQPDILFIPLRGASPIRWLTERFVQEKGEMPHVVELPIGTYSYLKEPGNPDSMGVSGMKFSDKARITAEALDGLKDKGLFVPGSTKLMLADEVQYGSTIVDAARGIIQATKMHGDTSQLGVFSVKDGRVATRRIDKYRNLVRDLGIKDLGTTVDSLFVVDSVALLDGLFNTNPELPPSLDTIQIVPNNRARTFFSHLYELYRDPLLKDVKAKEISEMEYPGNPGAKDTADTLEALPIKYTSNDDHVSEWVDLYSKALKNNNKKHLK